MAIMCQMRDGGHLDADLFDLFVAADIPLRYARAHMDERMIDEDAMRRVLSRSAADTRM